MINDVFAILTSIHHNMAVRAECSARGDTEGAEAAFNAAEEILRDAMSGAFDKGAAFARENDGE